MRAAFLLCLTLLAPLPATAAQSCRADAMLVFDGSGSMSEIAGTQLGVRRISEARQALRQVVPKIAAARRLGLVIYGPAGDRTCRNVDLRFTPRWQAGGRLMAEVDALRPAGGTPLTDAVRVAADTLRRNGGAVVLITDGKETCGGAPCALAARLAAKAPGLAVHVIGFKLPPDMQGQAPARCLADATGGYYLRADSMEALADALRITLGCNVFGLGGHGQGRSPDPG